MSLLVKSCLNGIKKKTTNTRSVQMWDLFYA